MRTGYAEPDASRSQVGRRCTSSLQGRHLLDGRSNAWSTKISCGRFAPAFGVPLLERAGCDQAAIAGS